MTSRKKGHSFSNPPPSIFFRTESMNLNDQWQKGNVYIDTTDKDAVCVWITNKSTSRFRKFPSTCAPQDSFAVVFKEILSSLSHCDILIKASSGFSCHYIRSPFSFRSSSKVQLLYQVALFFILLKPVCVDKGLKKVKHFRIWGAIIHHIIRTGKCHVMCSIILISEG